MTQEKILANRLHWAVTAAPLVAIALFYSLVLHARLSIGEWPRRSGMDVNDLSEISILFGLHAILVFLAVVMTSLTPVAWIALLSQAHLLPSLRNYCLRFIMFIACLATTLWIGFNDPGNYLDWFFE